MLAEIESVALVGTEAYLVRAEVDANAAGLPKFVIVGLPAKSVREAEQRVRSAINASGRTCPSGRTVANLAPGGLRKEGTHFDLPLALGILESSGQLSGGATDGWVAMGELSLAGEVRAVRGVLAAAVECKRGGRRGLICPEANAPEASLVEGIDVVGVSMLRECIEYFKGEWTPRPIRPSVPDGPVGSEDMSEVRGHRGAKRAAEIAAAGGHNLLMDGPPGSGKTMLARRIPSILPPMSEEESLEVTRIHSVAGLLPERTGLITTRPFRSPHHGITLAGLIGGGTGMARPGEVSLAHHGVLFLDEIALFGAHSLDALRGPVEDGTVRIARAGGVVCYPCRFSLVAAMNPCPCGHLHDPSSPCRCDPYRIERYRARLSGPLLDRFDVKVNCERVGKDVLLGGAEGECSEAIRTRVAAARAAQTDRYSSSATTNSSAPRSAIEDCVELSATARSYLSAAIDSCVLSGRGLDRVKRIARTIADLAGSDAVRDEHVGEALSHRLRQDGDGDR